MGLGLHHDSAGHRWLLETEPLQCQQYLGVDVEGRLDHRSLICYDYLIDPIGLGVSGSEDYLLHIGFQTHGFDRPFNFKNTCHLRALHISVLHHHRALHSVPSLSKS